MVVKKILWNTASLLLLCVLEGHWKYVKQMNDGYYHQNGSENERWQGLEYGLQFILLYLIAAFGYVLYLKLKKSYGK